MPDTIGETTLSADAVMQELRDMTSATAWLGQKRFVYESVTSTMDVARGFQIEGEPVGTAIIAGEQTHGRGQRLRPWHSPPFLGILCSVILPKDVATGIVSQLAACAVRQALAELGVDAVMKWPNDVLAKTDGTCQDFRKIAGILIERHGENNPVLGIGINVNHDVSDFTAELQNQATSIFLATGRKHSVSMLLARMFEELEQRYDMARWGTAQDGAALLSEWRRHSVVLGRNVQIHEPGNEPFIAEAVDIQPDGALVIEQNTRRRQVHSASIRPVPPEQTWQ